MKLKSLSLISLLCGIVLTVIGVAPFNGFSFCLILFGAALIVTALFCLIFSKTIKANSTIKTSAISLCLSAVGALGLVCALIWYTIIVFHEMSKHPISYPVSVFLGIICFVFFIILIVLYFKHRRNSWSIKGVLIDVLTSIIYLPFFFFAFYYLSEALSRL